MIIISENTAQPSDEIDEKHFRRIWSVLDYLTREKGIDRNKINISVEGTALKELDSGGGSRGEGVLEITLLERSS